MEKSCTIQDAFERFYPVYEKKHELPAHHRKAAFHIMNCKTGAFGVNISVCEDCGCISIHNNSCRSRCCPIIESFQIFENQLVCLFIIADFKAIEPFAFNNRMEGFNTCIISWKCFLRITALHIFGCFFIFLCNILTPTIRVDD